MNYNLIKSISSPNQRISNSLERNKSRYDEEVIQKRINWRHFPNYNHTKQLLSKGN